VRLLITTDTVGGVWRFSQELVKGLLEAGDAVALVSFGPPMSSWQRSECLWIAARWGERFTYRSANVPLEWMQKNENCMHDGEVVLKQVAKEFRAELLHSNQFCYGATDIGIPVAVTAHSDVLSWARACRDGLLEDSKWLTRYCELVQSGLNCASTVIAPTQWMLRALQDSFQVPCKCSVIANGRKIHSARVRQRRLQAATAGRLWDEAKDIAMLADVHSPFSKVVAGETQGNSSALAALGDVEFRGTLREDEMLRLFSESSVYVCTSRYEPFGLAPLEAALTGCAVLARDIGSLREVWGDAAIYFDNACQLSTTMTELANRPARLHLAQERACQRAQLYTRERMTSSYRALYDHVLAKEHARVA
jgi:glycogen synthase